MVVPERTIWILKGLHLEFNRGLFNLNSLCVEGWGSFISSVFMPWRRHQIQPSFNDLCIEPKDIQQHRRNTKMSFSKAAEDCHNWNNSPFRTCCQIWDCYILLTIMSGLHWVKGDSHIDMCGRHWRNRGQANCKPTTYHSAQTLTWEQFIDLRLFPHPGNTHMKELQYNTIMLQ